MFTITACFLFFTHAVHKTRFIKQGTRHLHSFKTIIQYLIYFFTRN